MSETLTRHEYNRRQVREARELGRLQEFVYQPAFIDFNLIQRVLDKKRASLGLEPRQIEQPKLKDRFSEGQLTDLILTGPDNIPENIVPEIENLRERIRNLDLITGSAYLGNSEVFEMYANGTAPVSIGPKELGELMTFGILSSTHHYEAVEGYQALELRPTNGSSATLTHMRYGLLKEEGADRVRMFFWKDSQRWGLLGENSDRETDLVSHMLEHAEEQPLDFVGEYKKLYRDIGYRLTKATEKEEKFFEKSLEA